MELARCFSGFCSSSASRNMTDPDSIEWPDAAPAPLVKAPRRSREVAPVEPVHPADEEWTPPVSVPPPSHNGRIPPSSTPQSDPEECLLSCCLIEEDNGQVLRRCEEAGITPDSFSDPKHAIVYGRLQRMRAAGLAITTAILGQELPKEDLERIGKWPFILQITKATSTTAEAGYFIESVRNRAILGEVIAQSKRRIEIASANGIDVPEFLAEYQREAASLSSKALTGKHAEIMARAFDLDRLIPKPDRIYSISGVTVCTPGNLTTIYSQAKTGKSSFIAAMISATMTNPTAGHDTLGVEGPNYAKHAVVHFDTEQSPYDWQQLVRSSLRRAGLPKPPPWLMSFTIAGMEANKAEQFVHAALRLSAKIHGGIHSVFIDGIADLVNDPNSPDECFPLIARLHAEAIQHSTAIINILHLNPTAKDKSDKGRGHLGSQLERKCESNLTLKKDGEVTVVVAEGRQRGQPLMPDKSPAFRWSNDAQMHVTTKNPVKEADESKVGRGKKPTYAFSEMKLAFPAHSAEPRRLREIHKAVIQTVPIKSETQFYNILQRFVSEGTIESVEMVGGRGYRLAV